MVGQNALTAEQIAQIPHRVGNGETRTAIAKEYGVTQPAITHHARKDEAKEIIEREARRLIAALPDITQQTLSELKTSAHLDAVLANNATNTTSLESNADILAYQKLIHKKQDRIQAMAGLMPSNAQSVVITNIYNDNRSAVLTPAVAEALGSALGASMPDDGEVIDVEPVEGG